MNPTIDMVAEKYPQINVYLFELDTEVISQFVRFLTVTLYIRQLLNRRVSPNEPYYDRIDTVDKALFNDIPPEDLYQILRYVIHSSCCYIDDNEELTKEQKQNIIDYLVQFA